MEIIWMKPLQKAHYQPRMIVDGSDLSRWSGPTRCRACLWDLETTIRFERYPRRERIIAGHPYGIGTMTSSSATRRVPLGLAKRTGFLLGFILICLFLSPARASDDRQEIKRCRSIVAEAAFLVELWSQGNVTDIFARGFLETAQEQLASSVENPDLDAGVRDELKAASSAIEARDAGTLRQISNELYARERQG
jgi:hypothetical protein